MRIENFLTLGTNEMWVRMRFGGIVPAGTAPQADFKNFTFFFEHGDGFIHGCQAGHGEINPHPRINFLYRRVRLAFRQDAQNGQPLGGQAVAVAAELLDQGGNAGVIIHEIIDINSLLIIIIDYNCKRGTCQAELGKNGQGGGSAGRNPAG